MTFRERLYRWHGDSHGAIRAFSKKVGAHEVTVGNWLDGSRRPGASKIPAIAKELGISPSDVRAMFPPKPKLGAADVYDLRREIDSLRQEVENVRRYVEDVHNLKRGTLQKS